MEIKTVVRIMLGVGVVLVAYAYAFVAFADTTFERDLYYGITHLDVQKLQTALNRDPATAVSVSGAGSPGEESLYFGPKTRSAVMKFQSKYGISPVAGYVGPITRAKLGSLGRDISSAVGSSGAISTDAARYEKVCNTSLIGQSGYDSRRMIDKETCEKLNSLYAEGKAAGNVGDLYVNRDNLHVNLCEGWTPSPDCPLENRLFYQHDWKITGGGAAVAPYPQITLGQASYSGYVSGDTKHGIVNEKYKNQSGANEMYNMYKKNNLFIYPSLREDSYKGSPYDIAVLSDPRLLDEESMSAANTPYVIASKQICKCGAETLRIHDASGSELSLIELGFAGLAAFRPEVKRSLREGVTIDGEKVGMIMPTLQALMRYSHRSVSSEQGYLSSIAHGSSYTAHYLKDGDVVPAYSASKIVSMANSMSLADVPPLVRLKVVRENFSDDEKTFTTPGAIARNIAYNNGSRSITISAEDSVSIDGTTGDHLYYFSVLSGGESRVKISRDPQRTGLATLEFVPSDSTGRVDVGVFVKKRNGAYYSIPGMVTLYVHP